MKIDITDEYWIETDSYNFIICKKVNKPTKKRPRDNVGYYNTLENALKGLVIKHQIDSLATSLDEVRQENIRLHEQIVEAIRNHPSLKTELPLINSSRKAG